MWGADIYVYKKTLFSYGSESDLTTVISNRFLVVNFILFHLFEIIINDFIKGEIKNKI